MKIIILGIVALLASSCGHKLEEHGHEEHEGHEEHKEHKEVVDITVHFEKHKQAAVEIKMSNPEMRKVFSKISIPAIVKADPRYSYTVSSSSRGIFSFVSKNQFIYEGKIVKKGETLARIYPAADQEHWTTIEQSYNSAKTDSSFLQKELQRIKELSQKGVIPEKELLSAQNKAKIADNALKTAEKRLMQLQGIKGKSISVKSPVNGVIRKIFRVKGSLVDSGSSLFDVIIPDKLIVEGELLKGDITQNSAIKSVSIVRSGSVSKTIDTEKTLKMRKTVFDYNSLSSKLQIPFESSNFSVGEPVELELETEMKSEKLELTVPRSSVIEIGTKPYLVVFKKDEFFKITPVTVGSYDQKKINILKGIKAKDMIVTKGAYEIYASSQTESMNEHEGHNH